MNPAFAIAEVVWILAGREDSAFPTHWNPRLPGFQGSGAKFAGAYGHRIRVAVGFDQLQRAADALSSDEESRQVVLQIWDSAKDFPDHHGQARSEDVPCNIVSMLKLRGGRLEWTQVVRSNDLFLGVPHNFVQFTSLQEILAGWLRVDLGSYVHYSDSLHIYERDAQSVRHSRGETLPPNSDSLALPESTFREVFADLHRRAEKLTEPSLRKPELLAIAEANTLPRAYENWIALLAADTARRRKWIDEMQDCATHCTNELLRLLWQRWVERNAS